MSKKNRLRSKHHRTLVTNLNDSNGKIEKKIILMHYLFCMYEKKCKEQRQILFGNLELYRILHLGV